MPAPPPPLPPLNLSDRAKFHLSGPDAARYLNGQITSDLRKLAPGAAMPACLLDAKGRMNALVFIRAAGDGGFLLDGPASQREELAARLEKYLIADDVRVEDVTEKWALFFAEGSQPGLPPGADALTSARFGEPGWDVWAPAGGGQSAPRALFPDARKESDPLVEAIRISRSRPAWGAELTSSTLPGEAGLDTWAVDFAKGCYIGQEVVSRMKSVGHPARVLRRFRVSDGPAPGPGWTLHDPDGRPAGTVTSVTDGVIPGLRAALGYVKWACQARLFSSVSPDNTGSRAILELWD